MDSPRSEYERGQWTPHRPWNRVESTPDFRNLAPIQME